MSVTRAALDRALGIANALIKLLEAQGFTFQVDAQRGITLLTPKEGSWLTFTLSEYIRRTNHELTPAERQALQRHEEKVRRERSFSLPPTFPRHDYIPTGVLTVEIGRRYSRSWKDTTKRLLEQRLPEIVSGVLTLSKENQSWEIEEARKAEERRKALEQYELLTKRRAEETERFKRLEVEAANWERACRLREFASAAEAKAMANGGISSELRDWLDWTRAKANWLDPLVPVSDPILDAPEPRRPGGYWG